MSTSVTYIIINEMLGENEKIEEEREREYLFEYLPD
jgi:hypothetical protein